MRFVCALPFCAFLLCACSFADTAAVAFGFFCLSGSWSMSLFVLCCVCVFSVVLQLCLHDLGVLFLVLDFFVMLGL